MTENRSQEQDFAAVLMQHAGGRAHTEASKKLQELVEAVRATGKKGSITVKLTVNPDKGTRILKVDDSVTAAIPKDSRRSLWFPDDSGRLHRNDPNQDPLFDAPAEKIQQKEN